MDDDQLDMKPGSIIHVEPDPLQRARKLLDQALKSVSASLERDMHYDGCLDSAVKLSEVIRNLTPPTPRVPVARNALEAKLIAKSNREDLQQLSEFRDWVSKEVPLDVHKATSNVFEAAKLWITHLEACRGREPQTRPGDFIRDGKVVDGHPPP